MYAVAMTSDLTAKQKSHNIGEDSFPLIKLVTYDTNDSSE